MVTLAQEHTHMNFTTPTMTAKPIVAIPGAEGKAIVRGEGNTDTD